MKIDCKKETIMEPPFVRGRVTIDFVGMPRILEPEFHTVLLNLIRWAEGQAKLQEDKKPLDPTGSKKPQDEKENPAVIMPEQVQDKKENPPTGFPLEKKHKNTIGMKGHVNNIWGAYAGKFITELPEINEKTLAQFREKYPKMAHVTDEQIRAKWEKAPRGNTPVKDTTRTQELFKKALKEKFSEEERPAKEVPKGSNPTREIVKELLKEDIEPPQKLKVGDKVKVVGGAYAPKDAGTVTAINGNGTIHVKFKLIEKTVPAEWLEKIP